VEDVRPFIDRSTIYICPIRSGSGIKNRLLEAMAMRKPIVAFAKSCEALNVNCMENILLANNPQEFTKGIITLLKNPVLREKIADNARQLVEKEYSWERTIRVIEESYKDAIKKKKGNYIENVKEIINPQDRTRKHDGSLISMK
jgi:glycosyltransferase involved in cell wall biosynthesis